MDGEGSDDMKTACSEIDEQVINRVALDDVPSSAGRMCLITPGWVLVEDADERIAVVDLWHVRGTSGESSWSPIFREHVSYVAIQLKL
jgi:hypothetical protein